MKDFYQSPVIFFGLGHYDAVAVNDYDTCKEFFNNPDVQGRVPAYPALVRTFGEKHGRLNFIDWINKKLRSLKGHILDVDKIMWFIILLVLNRLSVLRVFQRRRRKMASYATIGFTRTKRFWIWSKE